MKIHKQIVLIESHKGYLEVVSFYNTTSKTFGADVFYDERLVDSIISMKNEPNRDHLLSIGYSHIKQNRL